jgi:hypothetical protein
MMAKRKFENLWWWWRLHVGLMIGPMIGFLLCIMQDWDSHDPWEWFRVAAWLSVNVAMLYTVRRISGLLVVVLVKQQRKGAGKKS